MRMLGNLRQGLYRATSSRGGGGGGGGFDVSQSIEFTSAANSKVVAANATILDSLAAPDGPLSLSIWAKPTVLAAQTSGVMGKSGSGFTGYGLLFLAPSVYASYVGETPYVYGFNQVTPSFVLNTWCHLVFTKDASTTAANWKGYFNGSVISNVGATNGGGTTLSNGGVFTIGADPSQAFGSVYTSFNGLLQNASVHSKELSSVEVSSIYNAGIPRDLTADIAALAIEGWWRLGVGDTLGSNGILDSSGNGYHLSPVNSPTIVTDGP